MSREWSRNGVRGFGVRGESVQYAVAGERVQGEHAGEFSDRYRRAYHKP